MSCKHKDVKLDEMVFNDDDSTFEIYLTCNNCGTKLHLTKAKIVQDIPPVVTFKYPDPEELIKIGEA